MAGNSRPKRTQARYNPNRNAHQAPEMIELVDPAWILKALGGTLSVGLLLAYVTVCMLFAYKQWQLVMRPSRTLVTSPAALGMASSDVRFGVNDAGQPQIDGWWIPAEEAKRTVLMLDGADGNMGDALPAAQVFHDLGLNVLLFDYRGYGRSGGQHPAEEQMQEDAQHARQYLLDIRKVPAQTLVVYGRDIGASVAVNLCLSQGCPVLILDAPDGDLYKRVAADPRAQLVPAAMLFHERFPLAKPLQTLSAPKLIVTYQAGASEALRSAADPKMLVTLRPGEWTLYSQAVRRFLGEYR